MNFDDVVKLSTVGGDGHARQAWDAAVSQIKAALPEHVAAIDAALAPEPDKVEAELARRAAEQKEARDKEHAAVEALNETSKPEGEGKLVKVAASDSGNAAEGKV